MAGKGHMNACTCMCVHTEQCRYAMLLSLVEFLSYYAACNMSANITLMLSIVKHPIST